MVSYLLLIINFQVQFYLRTNKNPLIFFEQFIENLLKINEIFQS